uniref:CSON010845 protein n=1 Tax=Culicoides sonorensis TaxID=179676 RepID=A0A336KGX4_CULSO
MDNNTTNTKNAFPERQSSQDSGNSIETAVLNGAQLRRPQTLISSSGEQVKPYGNTIELTIHKDSNGYGMKVSGDNPVFVESVKPSLAAQRAGLMAGDMILKVNGTPVRYSSHVEVVKLIKASEIVHLTIQRSQTHQQQHQFNQMPRPMSTSITNSPSTPLAQRSSITAPLPVDLAKRKEMEYSKMKTLQLMLDEEKKNLDLLLSDKKQQTPEIAKAQATIRTLQEQLNQVCGEVCKFSSFFSSP